MWWKHYKHYFSRKTGPNLFSTQSKGLWRLRRSALESSQFCWSGLRSCSLRFRVTVFLCLQFLYSCWPALCCKNGHEKVIIAAFFRATGFRYTIPGIICLSSGQRTGPFERLPNFLLIDITRRCSERPLSCFCKRREMYQWMRILSLYTQRYS